MEALNSTKNRRKKIIVAPLDWGLGHATRCIPIIRYLIQCDCDVVIISSGRSLSLLQNEFPQLNTYHVPAYNIEYQRSGNFILKIGLQLFKIFSGIGREHRELRRIARIEQPDFIISDNRYGMYHRHIPCAIISHQLMIKIPGFGFMEPVVKRWLYYRHSKFNALWVPDMENEPSLAGDLSHKGIQHTNTKYLGLLTRFNKVRQHAVSAGNVLVIISGPEPQRTLFEDMILQQAAVLPHQFIVVSGKSEIREQQQIAPHIALLSHCTGDALFALAEEAEIIISRGGYSTLMDLSQLNKKCIFIPTPGQTEQEYLVRQLAAQKQVLYADQADCDIGALITTLRESEIRFYIPGDTNFFKAVVHDAIATAG